MYLLSFFLLKIKGKKKPHCSRGLLFYGVPSLLFKLHFPKQNRDTIYKLTILTNFCQFK